VRSRNGFTTGIALAWVLGQSATRVEPKD
jgi:hypothetical protein